MPKAETLTTRERVRRLSAAGWTPRQIAEALKLSTQGVHYHLNKLNGKKAR